MLHLKSLPTLSQKSHNAVIWYGSEYWSQFIPNRENLVEQNSQWCRRNTHLWFWAPFSLFQNTIRCRRRSLRYLLPSKRHPLWRFWSKMTLRCGAVICLLVSVHGQSHLNSVLDRNGAVYCDIIWPLDSITKWLVPICIPFEGCCSWFWTNICREKGTANKHRSSNLVSFASKYAVWA